MTKNQLKELLPKSGEQVLNAINIYFDHPNLEYDMKYGILQAMILTGAK